MQAQLWVARAGKNPFINLSGLFKKQNVYGYLHLKNWTALTIMKLFRLKLSTSRIGSLLVGAINNGPAAQSSMFDFRSGAATSAWGCHSHRGGLSGFRFLSSGYGTSFTKKNDSNQQISQINSICPLWNSVLEDWPRTGLWMWSLFANGNLMVKLSKWKLLIQ